MTTRKGDPARRASSHSVQPAPGGMQKQQRVAAEVFEREPDNVAGAREARMSVAHASFEP